MKKLAVLFYDENLSETLGLLLEKAPDSSVLILGCNEAELMLPEGINGLWTVPEIRDYTAENKIFSGITAELAEREKFGILMFYGDRRGRSLAAETAAELKNPCFTDVNDVKFEDEKIILRRRVYGGNIEAELVSAPPAVLSLARAKGPECRELVWRKCEKLSPAYEKPGWLIESRKEQLPEGNGLADAKIVLAAGKGIGSRENYMRLVKLGEKLNAAVGASRAVVLSGWAAQESIIGQSGTITSPELCIVFGASGAAPFLIGVEQAKKLVAINTDSSAAVFKAADYGIIADCTEILGQMEKLLEAGQNQR